MRSTQFLWLAFAIPSLSLLENLPHYAKLFFCQLFLFPVFPISHLINLLPNLLNIPPLRVCLPHWVRAPSAYWSWYVTCGWTFHLLLEKIWFCFRLEGVGLRVRLIFSTFRGKGIIGIKPYVLSRYKILGMASLYENTYPWSSNFYMLLG